MTNCLISYLDPKKNDSEEDPLFSEYTYGDKGVGGRRLKNNVKKDDYLFFHTSQKNKRVITAFYKVEEIMDIQSARADKIIKLKYQNPHLLSDITNKDEMIVFGNPIKSLILKNPLEINKDLLNQLGIKYAPSSNQTELQALSSKFRNWSELSKKQVEILIKKIEEEQSNSYLSKKQLTSDEIRQLREVDIEQFIANNPSELGDEFKLVSRQFQFQDGKRLDLLVQSTKTMKYHIVEIKKGYIGLEVLKQIKGYIRRFENERNETGIKGIIVCQGILPHFEDDVLKKAFNDNVEIFQYGWMFSLQKI